MMKNVRYWQKAYFGAMGGNPWEDSKPKSKKKATGKKKTVAKKTGKRKTKRATTGDLFGLF